MDPRRSRRLRSINATYSRVDSAMSLKFLSRKVELISSIDKYTLARNLKTPKRSHSRARLPLSRSCETFVQHCGFDHLHG